MPTKVTVLSCYSLETYEKYVSGRMAEMKDPDVREFNAHLFHCHVCQQAVRQAGKDKNKNQ